MVRISIVGTGDTTIIEKTMGLTKEDIDNHLNSIAKELAEHTVELIVLSGIEIELAKKFKIMGGQTVIAPIPIEDKDIGISHITQYIKSEIKKFPLFDGFIDTVDWFRADFVRPLLGDILLVLGYSPGTLMEIGAGLYMYKVITGKKEGANLEIEDSLLREIRAGKSFPYEIWVYKPFVSSALPKEVNKYCDKLNAKLSYIKSPEDIKRNLERVQ